MRFIIYLFLLTAFNAMALAEGQKSSGFFSAFQQAGGGLGQSDGEALLPPDEAFKLSVKVRDANTLVAEFHPAKDYYFYRDKITFKLLGETARSHRIQTISLPQGKIKNDALFGNTEVYYQPFQAIIALNRNSQSPQKLTLQAVYQGCNELVGVCYAPIEKAIELSLPALTALASAISKGAVAATTANKLDPAATKATPDAGAVLFDTAGTDANRAASALMPPQSESSKVKSWFKSGSFWLVIAGFFGIGILLSFTPCVLPMFPILSGMIAGHGHKLTRLRGFLLSLAYVLGMALTYTAVGIAAGLSGTLLSVALQNVWVLGSFALVFVGLSFSMFGFYELQLPGALQSKLANEAGHFQRGHFVSVFGMGALSALIVGPCVAAPLAGALLYISQSRDAVLGGAALFAMSLGMGLPLLLLGASAGALLPKAGAWMIAVKHFFGVLLLAVAIWLISPVIPAVAHMLLWAALLIFSAIYLHALDALPADASGWRKLWKGVGIVSLLLGVILLIGAASGGRDILQPLSGLRSSGNISGAGGEVESYAKLPFQNVRSVAELEQRVQNAAASGKYVMLDFYADWCVSCKEMERYTFSDPRVQAKLKDALLLKADVTANNADDKALLKRFQLFGPPGIVFFDRQGGEVPGVKVIGHEKADDFLAILDGVLI